MLAFLAIITGSIITGLSAYKIHAIRRGRDRKLRGMEVLRRLDIPPKKQVRVWSALLVLGLVLLTPGLGYLLVVDPIAGSEVDASYSNLMTTSSGTPTTVPLSEKLDKTPRTIEKDGSSSLSFFSSGGGGSKKSSSGGGGGSSTTKKNTSVIETSQEVHVDDARDHASVSYAYEANATPEITVTESDSKKTDEPYETMATGAESEDEDDETETTTLKDKSAPSAKIEPVKTEASIETAIIGVSPEKSTVPAFSGYSTEKIVSEEISPKEVVSLDAGNGSDQEESSTSSVVVEAASEKRTVPQTPEYPIDETGPERASEETSNGPEEDEANLDESPSPDVVVSSDEFESALPTPSSETPGSEHELETAEVLAEPEASEDDDNLARPGSIAEDSMIRGSDTLQGTEPKTTEVKKLLFGDSSTPEMNGSTSLSAEKGGESEGVVLNLGDLFGDLNSTSGSYVFEEDPEFMSRFQDFTMDGQTGMGTEMNSTLNSAPLLEFDTVDLRLNFRSDAGLTPTGPFA